MSWETPTAEHGGGSIMSWETPTAKHGGGSITPWEYISALQRDCQADLRLYKHFRLNCKLIQSCIDLYQ